MPHVAPRLRCFLRGCEASVDLVGLTSMGKGVTRLGVVRCEEKTSANYRASRICRARSALVQRSCGWCVTWVADVAVVDVITILSRCFRGRCCCRQRRHHPVQVLPRRAAPCRGTCPAASAQRGLRRAATCRAAPAAVRLRVVRPVCHVRSRADANVAVPPPRRPVWCTHTRT